MFFVFFGIVVMFGSDLSSLTAPEKDSELDTILSLFQLNPPSAEEIHLRRMKSLKR